VSARAIPMSLMERLKVVRISLDSKQRMILKCGIIENKKHAPAWF
jgi:hypothetical protein